MFPVSIVVLTHSLKTPQLKQMMRFLYEREETLHDAEIILISQDEGVNESFTAFENTAVFNLDLKVYNRPIMANFGVSNARADRIVLLDDDRIFLPNFIANALNQLKKGTFCTAKQILHISRERYDDEIKDCNFSGKYQLKSIENTIQYPNLFSGSTFFFKDDYLEVGGMDESFEGYGFNDSDMTQNVMENGMNIEFLNDMEFHLCHGHHSYDDLESVRNGLKFLKKWGKLPSKRFQERLDQHKHELKKIKFL